MRKIIYILTFDPKEVGVDEMHSAINTLTNSGDIIAWSHFIKTSYIFVSRKNSKEISEKIVQFLSFKKFFIVEINQNNYSGYQETDAWTWLKNQINAIYF